MNTTFIIWFDDPICQTISTNEKFVQEYKPELDKSLQHAAYYLQNTYGMTVRPSCFSFDNESKYNLFLLRFS